jgi:ATP phosphoribosyltransferase regulatory subunit
VRVRLPEGVRDYLPLAAARRRRVARALTGELERWGYQPLTTPVYEYDAVLSLGLDGAAARMLRFVDPASGEVVALRPDLTPQIARLVATRLADAPGPLRLFYEGGVVRAEGAPHRGARELYQVGVELVDAPSAAADLEVIALCQAALAAAGIDAVQIDLGHADFTRAALADLGLPPAGLEALRLALLKKDRRQVEAALARSSAPAARRRLCAELPDLYGGREVIARARRLCRGAELRALDELDRLAEGLHALAPAPRLSIDLGEVRGFDYYTGARFAVLADGAGAAVASGGRYDRLIERYGRPARAAGFAVDVDRAAEVLLAQSAANAAAAEPPCGWLLAGARPALFAAGAALRRQGERVVFELDERLPSRARLRERAARLGCARVGVVSRAGTVTVLS